MMADKSMLSFILDFAKAFDSINYNLSIFKLFNFGLKKGTLHWIASYLQNRELSVRIKYNVSDVILINCGIPQRSH